MCSVNTFSSGGATECSKCNEVTEYAGIWQVNLIWFKVPLSLSFKTMLTKH